MSVQEAVDSVCKKGEEVNRGSSFLVMSLCSSGSKRKAGVVISQSNSSTKSRVGVIISLCSSGSKRRAGVVWVTLIAASAGGCGWF